MARTINSIFYMLSHALRAYKASLKNDYQQREAKRSVSQLNYQLTSYSFPT